MEKLYKQPYENPDLAKIYEDRYIHHPDQKQDVNFEIRAIEKTLDYYDYESWCDVACGTGYHLRKTKGTVKRQGVDKSKVMIDQHKEDTEYDVDYSIANVLSWRTKKKFDLVTNFWFGYTHQPSLDKVLGFFKKMVDLTARHGTIIISLHNHWQIFDKIPRATKNDSSNLTGPFLFDSFNWSYKEPSTGNIYYCISPHKDLIIDTFAPSFKKYNLVSYPRFSSKELLVFRGKNAVR